MLRINDILDKAQAYLAAEELEMIQKAYIYSATVHQGQVRLSGEPYLTHPMEVAGILVDMKMDSATIISGLLHDTIEDTLTTKEQIEQEFGKDVCFSGQRADQTQPHFIRFPGRKTGGKFPQNDSGDVCRYPHPPGSAG